MAHRVFQVTWDRRTSGTINTSVINKVFFVSSSVKKGDGAKNEGALQVMLGHPFVISLSFRIK